MAVVGRRSNKGLEKKLIRASRPPLLPLLIVVALQHVQVDAIKCFSCEGLHCVGELCYGQYCMVSSYAAVWGQARFGRATHVKGCVNGTLLKRNIRSRCEVYVDHNGHEKVLSCICNADYCNANVNDKSRQRVNFVKCHCEGPHCGASNECYGEYCSYVEDVNTKQVNRGCVNRSVPLIERRSKNGCMRPPLTGATIHNGALQQSTNVESCLCSENFCNDRKPNVESKKSAVRCRTKAHLKWNDFPIETKTSHCYGDHCFNIEMNAHQSNTHYRAQGCISLSQPQSTSDTLNKDGCVEFRSSTVSLKTCFNEDQEEEEEEKEEEEEEVEEEEELSTVQTKPSKPKSRTSKPSTTTPRTEAEEEEEYEYEEDEEPEKEEEEKTSAHTKVEKTTSVLSSAKEKEVDAEAKPKHLGSTEGVVELEEKEDEAEEHVNDNTSLVVAFVVIMVIIAVVGLAWKCEIHKKIFRSRYQTVAGM